MKRTLYLIRHAMPDIPLGERWCVGGRSDPPLGPLGRLQAALLPFAPELRGVETVFCSSLIRAKDTAAALCPSPVVMPGLEEQDMGAWDGLSFAQIKARFPALYSAREENPSLLPEGAESESEVRARMEAVLRRCLSESEGDIAVVSHRTAISTLTGRRELLTHTAYSALYWDGEAFSAGAVGLRPHPALTDGVCAALLSAAGCDEKIKAHCRAVADLADELGAALRRKGVSLDAEAVRAAALLHDIARKEENHPALGALWLRELGWPELSEIVRQHHDPDGTELSEAAVVYIADKAVRGTERVPIDERFAASLKKCTTPEARAANLRRYEAAKTIRNEINQLCEEELIR